MPFIHYRTRGFVFKKSERGEADRVFTIFTEDFGRLEILAKAIRKINSKLRSGIDLFCFSEIEFIQGKAHKTLTDAIPLKKFENTKKDFKKLKIAFKISETLDDFLKFEEREQTIWNLIAETFSRLDKHPLPTTHHSLIYYYFFWNFLSILGYKPELFHCAVCQDKLTPNVLCFHFKEGGAICQNCAKKNNQANKNLCVTVNSDAVKILRIILKKDWQTLSKIKMNPESQKILKELSKNYYFYLLREHSTSDKII